jgi:hypothetical protein
MLNNKKKQHVVIHIAATGQTSDTAGQHLPTKDFMQWSANV